MIYEYSIYDTATGIVMQTGSADSEADVQRVVETGQAYVNARYNPGTTRIVDGVAEDLGVTNVDRPLVERRNELLQATDWTQVADGPLTDAKKAEWATYRQALRDLTNHANWPNLEETDWPTRPS